ncbi:MAG: hypothetical protein CR997_02650 [Acidobacteria bacterium]|nr:MAG: hypothetical protein CR997_02650 [Acidobacteriota bacterium]
MITGFNTDVKHKTKVYHVQTEDKGRENPKIETLVYMGGEILDSIKVPYHNDPPLEEKKISEMMETQHKRIIRNIKIGKFDELEEDEWELGNHSLDEAVLSYLSENTTEDQISVSVDGISALGSGVSSSITVTVVETPSNTPVEHAEIWVKLITSNKTPLELGRGTTSPDGKLILPCSIPINGQGSTQTIRIQVFSVKGTAEHSYPLS